ncbi:hypothetical protein AB0C07_38445 [Actinoplanes missouriensis]|uniref:hypothetical protein n=1 Tax=Actinoplanes missouriensis TaxID=1866 RepID=UPI0034007B1D
MSPTRRRTAAAVMCSCRCSGSAMLSATVRRGFSEDAGSWQTMPIRDGGVAEDENVRPRCDRGCRWASSQPGHGVEQRAGVLGGGPGEQSRDRRSLHHPAAVEDHGVVGQVRDRHGTAILLNTHDMGVVADLLLEWERDSQRANAEVTGHPSTYCRPGEWLKLPPFFLVRSVAAVIN